MITPLPNVVFDRIDDFVRVSWSQRTQAQSFIDVVFTPSRGTVLVDTRDFVATCTALIRTTHAWSAGAHHAADTRVARLAEHLHQDPGAVGRRAARRWVPGLDVDAVVPTRELAQLGETGRGGYVTAFLRSSDQVLDADAVTRCLDLFAETTTHLDRAALDAFTAGADAGIDPVEPWESGLRLARHMRMRFAKLRVCPVDGPVPIEKVVGQLGVQVLAADLGTVNVDGVCLMDDQARALAILNTRGRIAATAVGRRSTLAHELCHFAFDAPRFQVIGQADLRRSPDSIIEKRANAFAAELLLPRAVLLAHAEGYALTYARLTYLAKKFAVGVQLAKHQAANAGIRVTT